MTETIGRYEVLGRLALGGMAEILLARLLGPSGFERPVVIKRILPQLAEQPSFVRMFLDEARLAAQIQHKNVVQVHELGQEAKDLYLVMEYLEGENVAGLIRRTIVAGKELDPVMSAFVIAEACAGLHAAHELTDAGGKPLGLVHRDVSPQNIFVSYAGGVKVLDFGIAKAADSSAHTEAGQLKGKFEYMSPEQCRGRPIDRRSDVFALGIVLYEMITRKRLFKRSSRLATLEAVWRDAIIPPSQIVACPPSLEQVVLKALQKKADDRYRTAAEMRRDLILAVRELRPEVLPEEALGELMRELFEDRIASKREMLRRVRTGTQLPDVPSAEVDSGVDIPEVAPAGELDTGLSLGGDAYAIERARRRRRRLGAGSVAAGVAALAAAAWWLGRDAPAEQRLRSVGRSMVRPQLVIVNADPPPPPEVAEIVIDVTSTPEGASVRLGDRAHGVTPLSLTLPRSDQPLVLTLHKKGYRDASERVTPDVNQRLRVMLVAEPARGGVGPRRGNDGFRRFD